MSPKIRDPFTVIYEWRQRLIPDRIWYAMSALAIAIGSIIQGWALYFLVPTVFVAAVVLVVLQIRRPRSDAEKTAPDKT